MQRKTGRGAPPDNDNDTRAANVTEVANDRRLSGARRPPRAYRQSALFAFLISLPLPGLGFVYLGRPWLFVATLLATIAVGPTVLLIPVAVVMWLGAAVLVAYIVRRAAAQRPNDLPPPPVADHHP